MINNKNVQAYIDRKGVNINVNNYNNLKTIRNTQMFCSRQFVNDHQNT